jgi:hypothetical protein
MRKFNLTILTVILVLAMAGAVNAGMLIPANENAKGNAKAPEKSPVISETTAGEWDLERVDFIHYAKPDNPGNSNKPKGPKGEETCYKTLGVKWKALPVNYIINPTNEDGLSEYFVTNTIATAAETWDAETASELFNDSYGVDTSAEYGVQNYENAIVFGDMNDDNIIGVTSIWYTRRGKQLVEFDIKFNDYYLWGLATSSSIMDLQNIAVHELGHGAGLDDIYNDNCSAVTMYGYSGEGDIEKRDLEPADISGIQKLYGI